MNSTMRQSVWQSFLLHAALVLVFVLAKFALSGSGSNARPVKVEIREVMMATEQTSAPEIRVNNPPPIPPKAPPRKVFGLTRDSLQSGKSAAVEVKTGNTLAKDIDQEKMNPEDATSLPIPAEEYLVQQMPRLKAEIRIPYPAEAKAKNIEGLVLMDVLIDEQGKVRAAKLIEGPGYGLNEAAMAAIYRFEFLPAMMDKKPVAVRIRYGYRFVLN